MSHWQQMIRFWWRCWSRSGARNFSGMFTTAP